MPKMTDRLDARTNAQLAEIYNLVSERKVTKFADHSTAVKRTQLALETAGKDFSFDGEVVAIVDAGAPVATAKSPNLGKRIRILSEGNPKAKGSKAARRFDMYKNGMTVADYIKLVLAGGETRRKAVRDIGHDTEHGFISLD